MNKPRIWTPDAPTIVSPHDDPNQPPMPSKEEIRQYLESMSVKVELLNENAKEPTRATPRDAGIDIYASETVTLAPGEVTKIHTGIRLEFPHGFYGRLADRSSVSTQRKLFVVAGVIDEAYRGEILVALFNANKEPMVVEKGEKICQMLLSRTIPLPILVVEKVNINTDRSEFGFGSSGR